MSEEAKVISLDEVRKERRAAASLKSPLDFLQEVLEMFRQDAEKREAGDEL